MPRAITGCRPFTSSSMNCPTLCFKAADRRASSPRCSRGWQARCWARACFLTIAGTQMGSDVLPPLLRANMITRIAFQTSDRYKSLAVSTRSAPRTTGDQRPRPVRDAEDPTQLIETQNGLSRRRGCRHNRGAEPGKAALKPYPLKRRRSCRPSAGVRPELAREIAEWVVSTGQTDVRSVWAEYSAARPRTQQGDQFVERMEAVGLLGSQETARDPRPVYSLFEIA